MKPRIYVYQKLTAIINRYHVFDADSSEEKGSLVCFVEQKRGRLKEQIRFYKDETKSTELFSMHAEKVLDVHGKYFIDSPDGTSLGHLEKDFKKSLLKSTWYVYDADNKKVLVVTEKSTAHAFVRRIASFIDFIPIVGDIFGIFVALFRYHFEFRAPDSEDVVGKFEKLSIWRDRYVLLLDDPTNSSTDKRLLMAVAVSLDALQSR